MNFVLLGSDAACLPLVRAIARAARHALSAVAHSGESWPEISKLAPVVRHVADWQQLLIEPDVDAAIVAGHSVEVLEGARALARAGIPLVVIPDIRQTASFAYDLWPIEDDGRVLLIPLIQHDATGDAANIAEKMQSADPGKLKYVQLERTIAAVADGLLSLNAVENALLHDADLLRRLCGEYSRVTCVPVGLTAKGVAVMTVTLTGDGLPEATWRVSAASGPATAQLMIAGQAGTLVHDLCESASDEPASVEEGRRLEVIEQGFLQSADLPRWSAVVRAFDVVDAARRSIRRRRTVEIGSEEISEQRQFKSLMTAAGCGVLMYTMLAVVAALLIGVAADPRDAAQKRSAAAGFIVRDDEFGAGGSGLTTDGRAHVEDIASRLWTTTAEVVIEATPRADPEALVERRQADVEVALREAGAANVSGRVVTRPLAGRWFERLMIGVWVVVCAPIAILLALQLLGLAARPDSRHEPGNSA